jgi:DNA-binding transcriptional LysR family regulator
VVPLDVAQYYAGHGMLAIVPVELPITMAKLGIITRRQRTLSPATRAFLRTLDESILESRLGR